MNAPPLDTDRPQPADLITVYGLRIDTAIDSLRDLHEAGVITNAQLVTASGHLRDAVEVAAGVQVISS